MNKYVLFMTLVFFLVIMTLVAGAIDETASSNIFLDSINANPEAPGLLKILGTIWSYLSIFFRMLTFQISGIPAIINILAFYPITAGVIYMLVDIIRGNG
jgi:hypothetical protein